MEEDKNIMSLDTSNNPEEQIEGKNLPGIGLQYHNKDGETERKILPPARISNALTENMIATPNTLRKRFKLPPAKIEKESVDRNGNLVRLTPFQNRLVFAITYQLFSQERPNVTKYLDLLKEGKNPDYNVRECFIVDDICENVFGKNERAKTDKHNIIYEELQKISKRKLMQVYETSFMGDDGKTHSVVITDFKPYLVVTGDEKLIDIDDGKVTARIIELELTRIFFEKNWIGTGSRHYQFPPYFFDVKSPSGTKIKTDVYWLGLVPLFMDICKYNYSELARVKKYIKEERIEDKEKIEKLKQDALTHDPISFDRVKEIIGFDSKHPQKIERFKKYLWEGMWALIDRGVITEKSSINWEDETIKFVFSESKEPLNKPGINDGIERRPGGEWVSFSPKKRKRKTSK